MSKLKDNLELIGVIVLICIVFLVGKSCGSKEQIIAPKETITRYTDTIFPKDTIYRDTIIPKWFPKHDTVWVPLPKDSVDCEKVYAYDDTLIKKDYEVYTRTHVQGKLRALDIGVKLKVPLVIKDCTIVKRDTFIYRVLKYQIGAGTILTPKTIIPNIELQIKDNSFGVGYDLFNKYPIVTYKRTLWKSKK